MNAITIQKRADGNFIVTAPGTEHLILEESMSAKKKKQFRETLFPLPHNRKEKPTDANVLLHAICVAIRDGSSHAKLRKIISHLPKIMNRVNPYTATQATILDLEDKLISRERKIIELEKALKKVTSAPKGAKEASA